MDKMTYLRAQWDRALAIALVALGFLLLLLGWFGVRDTAYPAEQIPYIVSGGLFGLFASGLGAVLWISADLRDEWRKLDDLEQAVRGDRPEAEPDPAPSVGAMPTTVARSGSARRRRQPLTASGDA